MYEQLERKLKEIYDSVLATGVKVVDMHCQTHVDTCRTIGTPLPKIVNIVLCVEFDLKLDINEIKVQTKL